MKFGCSRTDSGSMVFLSSNIVTTIKFSVYKFYNCFNSSSNVVSRDQFVVSLLLAYSSHSGFSRQVVNISY